MNERLTALVNALSEHSEKDAGLIAAAVSALKPSTAEFVASVVARRPEAARAITPDMPSSLLLLAHQMRRIGSSTPAWPRCPRCSQPATMWLRGPEHAQMCRRCHDNYDRGVCRNCGKLRVLIMSKRGAGTCHVCHTPRPRRECTVCGKHSTAGRVVNGQFVCVNCGPKSSHPCARCGRQSRPIARMLGGFVCALCYSAIKRAAVPCPRCASSRILSELGPGGDAICAGCAGVPARYACQRCGSERFHFGRLCGACTLSDTLDALFGPQDSTPFARALHAHFRARPDPTAAREWLRRSPYRGTLAAMAAGKVRIGHATIDELPQGMRREFIRELLIECKVLPSIDLEIHGFELWLNTFLMDRDVAHARIIQQYSSWVLLRHLRRSAETAPVRKTQIRAARTAVRGVAGFLEWLDANDLSLEHLPQDALDSYTRSTRGTNWLPAFVRWARRLYGTPARPPGAPRSAPTPSISEATRLSVYRAIVNDGDRPAGHRFACGLTVAFGVSLRRVAELLPSMFSDDGDVVNIFLRARKPTPLPKPLAELYREHIPTLPPDAEWLLPGRRFHRHVSPGTIGMWMHRYGVPTNHLRVAAYFHLAGSMSSKILSDSSGLGKSAAARYVASTGSAWNEAAVLYDFPDWKTGFDLSPLPDP